MPRILTESNGYIGTNERVKLCPHCLNTVAYSFSEVRREVKRLLDVYGDHVGYTNLEYITCPRCNTRITLELKSTEHL